MTYVLEKYETRMNLTHRAMDCKLTFTVYFFNWKMQTKIVDVYLSNYVVWRDFFDFWDKCISDKSKFSKEAFKKKFF